MQSIQYLQGLSPCDAKSVNNRKCAQCHVFSFLEPEFNDGTNNSFLVSCSA